ncbi:SWIM zinc finger domain-containing protein [Sphaerisporangium sp. TRM90804]|uniref:SWIM zinc finger domain-containing protein n=1 Tax=Sphaerisporangium sp. TRM90804 TaxID=3031113 RepID=UPI00244BFC13|nr:SWIM zinc finger domain-containing protein [Sphaerisporangium sp. TRM90804]MDH2424113.1 SWIM zinc finger domain-containing protein [Sphaerisporangium sp. TRM90804]
MIERWSRDQVLALAPDASSQKGAKGVCAPAKWSGVGIMPDVVWGECAGSGAKPYRACVDLAAPAYRCSCPSRKFPCKHALGLLLLWSADGVPSADDPPAWVGEWLDQRRARAAKAEATSAGPRSAQAGASSTGSTPPAPGALAREGDTRSPGAAVPGAPGVPGEHPAGLDAGLPQAGAAGPGDTAAARRAVQRAERVTSGLAELERWLADQIAQGLAGARQNAPAQWGELARRLVDAQAPGVAAAVARLPRVLAEDDWPARLLGEYGLIHLLAVGHRRAGELPAPLRDTIRSRVGFPITREQVLAGETVRDHWHVLGKRDDEQDRLMSRRVWLRGRETGRVALVLSFAPAGQALDASLVTGTSIDADLAFYPGSSPLRAVVATRHATAQAGPPSGGGVRQALTEVAAALEGDPWLDSWPVVLTAVTPARNKTTWLLTDTPLPPITPAAGPARDVAAAPAETPDAVGDVPAEGAGGEGPVVEGLPLRPAAEEPWRLLAVSGGLPVTVAAEWTPRGLRPLTTWDEEGRVVVL